MTNHHSNGTEPKGRLNIPSPWIFLGRLLGWAAVGFVILFLVLFLLAMVGVA